MKYWESNLKKSKILKLTFKIVEEYLACNKEKNILKSFQKVSQVFEDLIDHIHQKKNTKSLNFTVWDSIMLQSVES